MASIINATTTNGVVASGDNSGVLQLATNNGTTAVTIGTDQKVGIGTSTLTNRLNVAGAIQSSSTLVAVEANTVALSQESGYSRLAAFGPNSSTGGTLYLYSISSNGSVQNGAIIDSLGRMTMPSQPSFRAYATSAQSPAPGAVIVFNNTSASGMFNTGGHYNTSNGRFTAPVTGVYAISFSVLYQSCPNGQYGDTSIYRNGGTMININRLQYQSTYTGYGGYLEARASVVIQLSAGDYITVNNGSASTQSLYVNDASWTWFSGWLLG